MKQNSVNCAHDHHIRMLKSPKSTSPLFLIEELLNISQVDLSKLLSFFVEP